jgi:hypothetical protein
MNETPAASRVTASGRSGGDGKQCPAAGVGRIGSA